jgi:large subunit ribosomal protein L2
MPSGEHRLVSTKYKAFYGQIANENHMNIIWRKAGKSRWLNKRPTVRGVAKNPIDHPHGGNTSGGCHPVTPWARLTKGKPTRKKNRINKLIIKPYKNRKL